MHRLRVGPSTSLAPMRTMTKLPGSCLPLCILGMARTTRPAQSSTQAMCALLSRSNATGRILRLALHPPASRAWAIEDMNPCQQEGRDAGPGKI